MLTKDKFTEIYNKYKEYENLKDAMEGIISYDSKVFEIPSMLVDKVFECLLSEEGLDIFYEEFYNKQEELDKLWDDIKDYRI